MRRECAPILDLIEAINWTVTVNRILGCAMTPQQVTDLPEEALWIVGAILEHRANG